MTAAERQQRRRDRRKAALPKFGSEERFRLELYRWVYNQSRFYSGLDASKIGRALDELGLALKMDVLAHVQKKKDQRPWITDYFEQTGLFSKKDREPKPLIGGSIDSLFWNENNNA